MTRDAVVERLSQTLLGRLALWMAIILTVVPMAVLALLIVVLQLALLACFHSVRETIRTARARRAAVSGRDKSRLKV